MAAIAGGPILAAPPLKATGADRPPERAEKPESPSPIKMLLADQPAMLEAEIAGLAQRRADLSGSQASVLELLIDLRIIARSLITCAMESKTETEPQIIATLRAISVLSALSQFEKRIAEQPVAQLSPAQAEALKAINQLTYQLGDVKSTQQTDQICKTVGDGLVKFINEAPPSQMRPDFSLARTSVPREKRRSRPQPQAGPRTLPQLEAEARQMSVSAPLRRELLALARQASIEKGDEAAILTRALQDSVDLSAGLAANFAVDPETRGNIEQRLAEGIALFCDIRTRSAGQKRFDAINPYRQLLSRAGRLKLPAEMTAQLGPAFAWARVNLQSADKILASMEQFATALSRFSQIGRNPDLAPGLQKSADVVEQKFASHQSQFLADAQNLGSGGIMGADPATLQNDVDSLRRTADVLELINRIPSMVQMLVPYRPKLAVAFNKRMDSFLSAVQTDTPAGDDAARQLQLMDRLTQLAQDMAAKPPVDLSAEVVNRYGGDQLPAFDKRCQTMIGDAVNDLALGGKIDESRLARISQASALRDALQDALLAEVTIQRADLLQRWADWPVSPAQLAVVMSPYQQAMVDAFAGFVADKDEPIERWKRIQIKYAALLAILKENAAYIPACAGLPTGLAGEAGRLMTPYDNQPFHHQRFASFMLIAWSGMEQSGDSEQADAIAQRLSKTLNLKR